MSGLDLRDPFMVAPGLAEAWDHVRRPVLALAIMGASLRGDETRVSEILSGVYRDGVASGAAEMRAEMKDESYR